MKKHDFIPHPDHDFLIWFENFTTNLTPESGLPESLLNDLKAGCSAFRMSSIDVAKSQAATKQIVANKNDLRNSNEALIRSAARLIKARLNYTEAEGVLLGIEGHLNTFNLATAKPDLSGIDKTGGIVFLSYTKNKSEGINLYGKRGENTDWILLGRVTSSPYIDNRPLLQTSKPELRIYTAVYMLKDQEIGEYSDEIVISCAP